MRGLATLAGVLALAVPSAAVAAGTTHAEAQGRALLVTPQLFAAVAVEACRDRQERPFGVVAGGERAARTSHLLCLRRILGGRPRLTRAVHACSERLAQRGGAGHRNGGRPAASRGSEPTLRALTDCSASLLRQRPASR